MTTAEELGYTAHTFEPFALIPTQCVVCKRSKEDPLHIEPEPVREEQEFDVYTASTEEMNAHGLCGFRLGDYSGRRCSRKIVTWFGEQDEETGQGQTGACGTHAKDVEREVGNQVGGLMRRQIARYLEHEQRKAINILNNAGLKARSESRHSEGGPIVIENWQILLAWLDDKGMEFDDRDWEKVIAEKEAVELAKICTTCGLAHEPLQEEGSYYPACDKFRPHKFFPMKNKDTHCAICEGPQDMLMHDETMLGRS